MIYIRCVCAPNQQIKHCYICMHKYVVCNIDLNMECATLYIATYVCIHMYAYIQRFKYVACNKDLNM